MTEDQSEKRGAPRTRLIPVTKWSSYYDWPTLSGLRHLIFDAQRNGFSRCVRRVGRRVLIDEDEFFAWVDSQNPAGGGRHDA